MISQQFTERAADSSGTSLLLWVKGIGGLCAILTAGYGLSMLVRGSRDKRESEFDSVPWVNRYGGLVKGTEPPE